MRKARVPDVLGLSVRNGHGASGSATSADLSGLALSFLFATYLMIMCRRPKATVRSASRTIATLGLVIVAGTVAVPPICLQHIDTGSSLFLQILFASAQ